MSPSLGFRQSEVLMTGSGIQSSSPVVSEIWTLLWPWLCTSGHTPAPFQAWLKQGRKHVPDISAELKVQSSHVSPGRTRPGELSVFSNENLVFP